MIQVTDVTKAFAGKKLFESVSTSFPPGRRYGLTGPNGAGKTTFMKILSGDLEPDTGSVSRPKRLSVLKQDQYAYEDKRVLDVVLMGNKPLWGAMQEKEKLLAKPDLSNEHGARQVAGPRSHRVRERRQDEEARAIAGVPGALLGGNPRFPGAEPHQAVGEALARRREEVEHRAALHQVRAEAAEREADAHGG